MKRILFTTFFALILCGIGQAQGLRLNGYAAYVFDNSFDTRYSNTSYLNGRINGGLQWGAGLEYLMSEDYGIELMYYRQDTDIPINYYYNFDRSDIIDASVNYIMIGGARYVNTGGPLQPYGGLMLGMAIFDNKSPEAGEPSGATKFAWGLRLGSNIWVSERVGLKAQALLLSAVQGFGGGFYFGTGGVGTGVSTYSTILQFSLGGGITINFGE